MNEWTMTVINMNWHDKKLKLAVDVGFWIHTSAPQLFFFLLSSKKFSKTDCNLSAMMLLEYEFTVRKCQFHVTELEKTTVIRDCFQENKKCLYTFSTWCLCFPPLGMWLPRLGVFVVFYGVFSRAHKRQIRSTRSNSLPVTTFFWASLALYITTHANVRTSSFPNSDFSIKNKKDNQPYKVRSCMFTLPLFESKRAWRLVTVHRSHLSVRLPLLHWRSWCDLSTRVERRCRYLRALA